MDGFASRAAWKVRCGAWAIFVAAAAPAALGAAAFGPALAQSQEASPTGDALLDLFAAAENGSGDPHLPYVLNDLKKALAAQNLLAFLELVDPAYFSEQFGQVHKAGRSPGESLGQFSCEFFSICDISKHYAFSDIVSADVLSVTPPGPGGGPLIKVRLELRMWDGLTLPSTVYYDPANARLSAARG